MKGFFSVFVSFIIFSVCNAQQVVKIAETAEIFSAPESVAYDSLNQCLYVSNYTSPLAEGGMYADHVVSKIDLQGNVISKDWVKGLSCPTGIILYRGKLYIVERFGIVECDPATAEITNRFHIKTTGFLNDITADDSGNLYITVSGTSKIYRVSIEKAYVEVWLDDTKIKEPNGVLYDAGFLVTGVNADGFLRKIDTRTKEITDIAYLGKGTIDGIKKCKGGYLVTHFEGNLYFIANAGTVSELLNTRLEEIYQADFEYIPSQELVVIPALWNNKLLFYHFINY